MVLLFVGALGFLVLNTKNLVVLIKEDIPVSLYLPDDVDPVEVSNIRNYLSLDVSIKQIEYISKEQAAEDFAEIIGEEFVSFLGYNPLQSSFEVNFHASYVSKENLEDKKEELFNEFPNIQDFVYNASILDMIEDNMSKFIFILLSVSFFLLLVSILLISNTIRLSIYSKRVIIKTMQLVGATKPFIRRPFVRNNLFLGFVSALIALPALGYLAFFVDKQFSELNLFANPLEIGLLLTGLVITSLLITGISTFIATNRYLNLQTEDAYKY